VFYNEGGCGSCHSGPTFTDVLDGPRKNLPVLHDPSEVGTDPVYAGRSATGKYRTTPLRALWQHPPYFHDGSAATLADVVKHYDRARSLKLTTQQQVDLVEYLKSL
jgi:cytochrome c peroxidase